MPYQRVTLATLKQRLQEKVGNSSVFWTPIEARDAINEAICYWQGLTGEWTEVRNVSCDGTSILPVPSQSFSVFRVSYVSSVSSIALGTSLVMTSLSELDNGFPGWNTQTGIPALWAPIGISKIAIHPKTSIGYLIMEGYKEAPVLITDTDYIDIGDEEIVRLLGYAQWYLAFKEGVQEAVENVSPLVMSMVQAAILRNKRLLKSAFYRDFAGLQREEFQRPTQTKNATPGIRHA